MNAIFGLNEKIFSVKTIIFIKKKNTKKLVFEIRMGEICRILSFYVKISQNWQKILGCPQNFGVLHLKM